MKKFCAFTLAVVLLMFTVVPGFAAVRCHLPGCDGKGGNLCVTRYANVRTIREWEEPGYDYENGHNCVYKCYLCERDVYATCNKNHNHSVMYHEQYISRSVFYWTD